MTVTAFFVSYSEHLISMKVPVREAIKKSGMEWTFIANGSWIDFWTGPYGGALDLKSKTLTIPVRFSLDVHSFCF